uniref:Chemerin chemokine-like receptor 1 n=1 Tax=Hucho hucho TaxID=62062 RepID=A0A4W5NE31_9TELE
MSRLGSCIAEVGNPGPGVPQALHVFDLTDLEDHVLSMSTYITEVSCFSLLVANVVICLLGVCGNGVVILIAGLKMKKTVNTNCYLCLAISDFIFCACLPFNIIYMVTKDWIFGLFMCMFTSFAMFLNMFSSIFLLVIMSVDRYVLCTVRMASAVLVLAWVISVAISIASIMFCHDTTDYTTTCFNNYPSQNSHLIVVCYSVIILQLRTNRMTRSSKPFRVMTALIAMFLIGWLLYHVFIILQSGARDQAYLTVIHEGLKISLTLASTNSCMNQFLYAFMGKDFKQKCWISFFSKIENAFDEEDRSTRSSSRTIISESVGTHLAPRPCSSSLGKRLQS